MTSLAHNFWKPLTINYVKLSLQKKRLSKLDFLYLLNQDSPPRLTVEIVTLFKSTTAAVAVVILLLMTFHAADSPSGSQDSICLPDTRRMR